MGSVEYAEKVTWRSTGADEHRMTLVLTDTTVELIHNGGTLDSNVSISGTGAGGHGGSVVLAGVTSVWIVHSDGITSLEYDRPQSNY
jgi:hypothetical protein